jgi:hypothetical protein
VPATVPIALSAAGFAEITASRWASPRASATVRDGFSRLRGVAVDRWAVFARTLRAFFFAGAFFALVVRAVISGEPTGQL